MCGRYALNISGDDLALEFAAGNANVALTPSNWNISPTTPIPFIASDNLAGDSRESIAEKPTFKSAFKSRRCLIPATGYYEWATELGKYKPKQPFYISNKDKSSIAIAGIYEEWINPQTSSPITTAAIITREVVGILKPIHHRMPVILPKSLWSTWLSNKSLTPQEVSDYLKMIDIKEADAGLTFWPVDDEVNNARNTGAQLAAQIELPPAETLF